MEVHHGSARRELFEQARGRILAAVEIHGEHIALLAPHAGHARILADERDAASIASASAPAARATRIGALPLICRPSSSTEPENTSRPWSMMVSESHISDSSGKMWEEISTVLPISLSVRKIPFHLRAGARVHAGGRLIQDEQAWIVDERPCQQSRCFIPREETST